MTNAPAIDDDVASTAAMQTTTNIQPIATMYIESGVAGEVLVNCNDQIECIWQRKMPIAALRLLAIATAMAASARLALDIFRFAICTSDSIVTVH